MPFAPVAGSILLLGDSLTQKGIFVDDGGFAALLAQVKILVRLDNVTTMKILS